MAKVNITDAEVIQFAAFSGVYSIWSLTLPFVGYNRTSTGSSSHFGYIFGTTAVGHSYQANGYYVPISLSEIAITDTNSIESGAFSGMSSISSLSVPFVGQSDTAIGLNAHFGYIFGSTYYGGSYNAKGFYIPRNLSRVNISNPSKVSFGAFSGVLSLESLSLPFIGESRTAKGSSAILGHVFGRDYYMDSYEANGYYFPHYLSEINITDSTRIATNAFNGVKSISQINVLTNNTMYASIDGVLMNKSQSIIVKYPEGKNGEYHILNGVTDIGNAFYGAINLNAITIPYSVSNIGDTSFDGAKELTDIYVDTNNLKFSSLDGVLYNKNQTIILKYPEGKIGSYVVPKSVTNMTEDTFMDTKITEIFFEDNGGLTTILDYTFRGANYLNTINIPSFITSIRYWGMVDIAALESINVHEDNMYYTSIDGVLFDKSTTTLLKYPEGRKDSYVIPNGTVRIESNSFHNAQHLISLTIPNSVDFIGEWAFYGAIRLSSVYIPASVIFLNEFSSAGASGLTSFTVDSNNSYYTSLNGVLFSKDMTRIIKYPEGKYGAYSIPSSVTSFGRAFFNARLLTSISIPNGVTTISDGAFEGAEMLTSISIPSGVNRIGYETFLGAVNLITVNLPSSVLSIETSAFDNTPKLVSINVDANNPNYTSQNGVLFNKNKTTLIKFPEGKGGSYVIPDGVITIGYSAFYRAKNLTGITIPSSVVNIYNGAFYEASGLTSIMIPNSVTNIGDSAFLGLINLTNLTIPNSVTSIGSHTFYGTYNLKRIVLSSNLSMIDWNAFSDTNSLTIYIKALSKPNGWHSQWNPDNRPTVWGYSGE